MLSEDEAAVLPTAPKVITTAKMPSKTGLGTERKWILRSRHREFGFWQDSALFNFASPLAFAVEEYVREELACMVDCAASSRWTSSSAYSGYLAAHVLISSPSANRSRQSFKASSNATFICCPSLTPEVDNGEFEYP